jgi:hypothetical protein
MHVRWWVHTHGARGVHGWVGSIAEVQGAWECAAHAWSPIECIHAWGDYIIRRSARMHAGESIECRVGREDPRVRRFELIGGVHIKPGFRSEKWEEWEGYIYGRALLRRPRPPI